jgi:CheY-like chemotaxis protein
MPSCLIVIAGPPLPGRWALARALARRLGAPLHPAGTPIGRLYACAVVHGDLPTAAERELALHTPADEHLLVEWMCSEREAYREIFHRWASRPRTLSEREHERYLAWASRAQPVSDAEAETVVHVGAQAPYSDQVLRVVGSMHPRSEIVPATKRRTNVLVVDDDPDQRILVGEVLDELGCNVELAPDAGVALAILEDPEHGIDLVISDERMPGMSGVELAAELARRHPQVRAILLTGYEGVDVDRALDARARNVLRKPVSIVDLQRVLDEVA